MADDGMAGSAAPQATTYLKRRRTPAVTSARVALGTADSLGAARVVRQHPAGGGLAASRPDNDRRDRTSPAPRLQRMAPWIIDEYANAHSGDREPAGRKESGPGRASIP